MPFSSLIRLGIILVSLAAIVLGLVARFQNLNTPLWADELQTIRVARGNDPVTGQPSLTYAWRAQQTEMMHPPGFMLPLHAWQFFGDSVAWYRLLPSIIGLVGLAYLYRLGKELEIKLPSLLLTLALTTISWVFVHYSEEVGTYSLSITVVFALCFYWVRFLRYPSHKNFAWLLGAALVAPVVEFANLLYLFLVGVSLLFTKNMSKFRWLVIMSVTTTGLLMFLFLDQLRFKSGGFDAPYMAALKLNSVPVSQMVAKFAKDNLDYLTYVFGATPWYLDATFFPSSVRFGINFTRYYYLSLIFVCLVILAAYLFKSFIASANWKLLSPKLLPLGLLVTVLVAVNALSLWGLYPIGPVRMSLFYSPLVIWTFMQFIDLALHRLNLMTILAVGAGLLLLINGLTRLYRVPQRHIGLNPEAKPAVSIEGHFQQQPAMFKPADIGRTVSSLAIADRQLDHLEI